MAGKLAITISAEDRASKVIADLNKRIAAMSAPAERLRREFGRLSESTGLRGFGRRIDDAASSADKLFNTFSRIVPSVGILEASLSAAGLAGALETIKKSVDFGSDLYQNAKLAGTSATDLQKFSDAVSLAGGSSSGAVDAMKELNQQLTYAREGGPVSGSFVNALSQMFGGDYGKILKMSPAQAMDAITKKLAAMNDPQKEKYFLSQLGGGFASLIPYVDQGSAALDEFNRRAENMVRMTDGQSKMSRDAQVSIRQLTGDVEGLALNIAGQFVPAAKGGSDALAAWIEQNHEMIESNVGDKIRSIANEINGVVQQLGGWKNASADLLEWYAARFLPGMAGAILRFHVLLKGMARYFGLQGIAGETDQQRQQYLTQQQNDFDDWVYKHFGFHTGQWDRMFGGGPGGGPSGPAPSVPSAAQQQATMTQVAQQLRGYGWKPEDVAAILTGLSAESQFNPREVGDNGSSLGLAQWHDDRVALYNQWAAQHGYPDLAHATVAQQTEFLNWDLTAGPHASIGAAMRNEKTARGKAYIYNHDYEVPQNPDATAAMRAQSVDEFMPAASGSPSGPAVAPPGGASGPPATLNSAPVQHTVNGEARVSIDLSGAPIGTKVKATNSGDLFAGTPRVTVMPYTGAPQ